MIVHHFLKWIDTARVSERAAAASALARAYAVSELAFDDRCAAEAALTLLLDDPSPKVRMAMAEALSVAGNAPVHVIEALASDQVEVAAMVLARSPVLIDAELIDRFATGNAMVQRLIAMRPSVSMALAAAVAEIGDVDACLELLGNSGAQIASLSFRRLSERLADDARIREALLADRRLPVDTRHLLLVKLGDVLKTSGIVRGFVGAERAERITRDACIKASLHLVDGVAPAEHGALVEHLRIRGDLTTGFIIRTVAHGKVDFFGTILVALSGQSENRVRSLLLDGRETAFAALLRKCDLPDNLHRVMHCALRVWREVANGKRVAGPQEVTWLMLRSIGATPGQSGPAAEEEELAVLLKAIHLDALRDNARLHALAIAAA
jgi:uncharacterized protein (DUF2336 family)